jgi:hypothetical protein
VLSGEADRFRSGVPRYAKDIQFWYSCVVAVVGDDGLEPPTFSV